MKASLIQTAIKKAKQSSCRFKVSAIGLDKNGKFLGAAYNRHRMSKKGGGIHAEIALLNKTKDVKTIILCRVGRSGDLLPIHPCKTCQRVLDKMNIKVYTIV